MEMSTFNLLHGYPEAIVRGYKGTILTAADYSLMSECDNLDDLKMHLSSTSYGNLSGADSAMGSHTTASLVERCTAKFVEEFNYLRCNADASLAKFLDYCTYPYMIDNVVLIVSGCLHNQHTPDLLEKCHPLGMFDSIATLAVAQNMQELYSLVLIDTPLGKYFQGQLSSEDMTEMHLEIMRNLLYKNYLEDFRKLCAGMGGTTAEVMADVLTFEADRRAIAIAVNSLGTELTREDKMGLFCTLGALHPHGHRALAGAEDFDSILRTLSEYAPYNALLSASNVDQEQMVDRVMTNHEIKMCKDAFEQQFHFGVFWAWIKLKEQEIRNLMWISECVVQEQHARIHDGMLF